MPDRGRDSFSVRIGGNTTGPVVAGSGNTVHAAPTGEGPPARPAPDLSGVHRVLVALDVQDSGGRDNAGQRRLHAAVAEVVRAGLAAVGRTWEEVGPADRGDGVALVLEPDAVPPARVLDEFTDAVGAAVREHARASSPEHRIRLRLAVHLGVVDRVGGAWRGAPLVHVARLVDAAEPKRLLGAREARLVLIVSDDFHRAVVAQGYGRAPAESYLPVDIAVKETVTRAWLRFPRVEGDRVGGDPE